MQIKSVRFFVLHSFGNLIKNYKFAINFKFNKKCDFVHSYDAKQLLSFPFENQIKSTHGVNYSPALDEMNGMLLKKSRNFIFTRTMNFV